MKKIIVFTLIFIVSICSIFATDIINVPTFNLVFHKAFTAEINFYKDEACSTLLDNVQFDFVTEGPKTTSTAEFYIKWTLKEESPISISLIASSTPGVPENVDDFCLLHVDKGEGGEGIGLNYQIEAYAPGSSSVQKSPDFTEAERDQKISLEKRTLANFYTLEANKEDRDAITKVILTAYAPIATGGTTHAFLEGHQNGYIQVRISTI